MNEEKLEKEISLGTLYDVNKNLVQNAEKELTEGIINSKKEVVKNFISKTSNHYYMLLCNEKRDYTIFNLKDTSSKDNIYEMVNILVDECLKNRGEIRGIDITKSQDAIEIWLSIEEEAFAYYFFPYDAAIIEI